VNRPDNNVDTLQDKAAAVAPERTRSAAAKVDPAAKGRQLVTILCTANLALLAIIIVFQIKIVSWQSSITTTLRKLETEVNQEKVKRTELGDNLLKKIDELTAAQPARATADTPVLAQPHVKANVIGQLKKGDMVTVEESPGEWRKISWNGKSGWVKAGWLKP
jgi:uncharacterized protein YgiM (DUF1202 family)